MADKKTSSEQPERIYTVPLRAEWLKGSSPKRAGRSIATVRKFLSRHMKAGTVKISGKLNERLWARGLKKPPASIRLKARMDKDGVVTAMLPEEIIIKEEEKGKMEKLKEKFGGGKEGGKKPAEAEEKAEEKPKEETAKAEASGAEKPSEEAKESPKETPEEAKSGEKAKSPEKEPPKESKKED